MDIITGPLAINGSVKIMYKLKSSEFSHVATVYKILHCVTRIVTVGSNSANVSSLVCIPP